jgi:hypothetical protein
VRRILAVTAAFEEPHSNQDINRLLLELGALGLLIVGIAAAIWMIRYSSRHAAPTDGDDGRLDGSGPAVLAEVHALRQRQLA